jgi:hypothetical protein
MAKGWAWGLGLVAVTGLIAVCARSIGAEQHVAPSSASIDPACIAGPGFSQAVCDAATASVDAPLVTAGHDLDARPAGAERSGMMIASADTTGIPAPAKAPFSTAAAPAAEAADAPAPGRRLAAEAAALTEAAERNTAVAAVGIRRQVASFSRGQMTLRRKLPVQDLAKRLGQAADFGDRARLYVFAGGGTGVVGYNVSREQGEITANGWSMENTAKVGSAQMGMAWRRGSFGLTLVGMQRKLAALGASVHDSVVALRFSWTPGAHRGPPSS